MMEDISGFETVTVHLEIGNRSMSNTYTYLYSIPSDANTSL